MTEENCISVSNPAQSTLRSEKLEDRKCLCLPISRAYARSRLILFLFVQSVFDELDGEEMRRARTRSNPYEMIRGVFFLNRSAERLVMQPLSHECPLSAMGAQVET